MLGPTANILVHYENKLDDLETLRLQYWPSLKVLTRQHNFARILRVLQPRWEGGGDNF